MANPGTEYLALHGPRQVPWELENLYRKTVQKGHGRPRWQHE